MTISSIQQDGQKIVRFLPKKIDGEAVLLQNGSESWCVESRVGIGYYLGKAIDGKDVTLRGPAFHEVVHGADEGDWIRVEVQDPKRIVVRYLPKEIDGNAILLSKGEGINAWLVVSQTGVAYRTSKAMNDTDLTITGPEFNEFVSGTDEGDWILVLVEANNELGFLDYFKELCIELQDPKAVVANLQTECQEMHTQLQEEIQTELDSLGSVVTNLQTDWKDIRTQLRNVEPQEIMDEALNFVVREQPKMWLAGLQRVGAQFSAACGLPDPAPAAPAVEASVIGRSVRAKLVPYLVDNSTLQSKSKALSYCFSKSLSDNVPAKFGAPWGCTVKGVDQGDGWLKVGQRYLPMELDGKAVLACVEDDDLSWSMIMDDEANDDFFVTEDINRQCTATQVLDPIRLETALRESQQKGSLVKGLPDLIDVGLPDLVDLSDPKTLPSE